MPTRIPATIKIAIITPATVPPRVAKKRKK